MTIENRFLTNKDKKLLREINRVLVEQKEKELLKQYPEFKKLKMQELKERQ